MSKNKKNADKPIDKNDKSQEHPGDGSQGRATFHTGSTVQGGSNFGQGSHSLGNNAYKQGQEKTEGANYDNETGQLSELPD
jgi:hypothetical protein